MSSRRPAGRRGADRGTVARVVGTAAVVGTVVLLAVSGCSTDLRPAAWSAPDATPSTVPADRTAAATTAAAPDPTQAAPDPAPAPPDPAPAPPDPAPAPPDPAPAAPDPAPAPPDPAPAPSPRGQAPTPRDPAPVGPAPVGAAATASRTPSPTALACDAVEEELTDAVIRYEVQALAEDGPGGGDRAAAGADMTAAMERARGAARAVPGLAAAAGAAMTETAALRDGLATVEDLSEEDAEAWRDARDQLEDWCAAQG